MKNQRNYYHILHVQPDAPAKIIRSSYRTLMQQLNAHPDRGGDTAQAALINSAYAVLSNARKRAQYDCELRQRIISETGRDEKNAMSREPALSPEPGICPFCESGHNFENEIPSDAFCATCKSPLCLADRQRLEQTDQRKIARVGRQTKLSYYTQWPQLRACAGVTDNISKQGMMFRTSQKVSIDSIVKLDCTQFQSIACVLSCRQAGNILRPDWHVGVEYLTLHFRSTRGVFIIDTV